MFTRGVATVEQVVWLTWAEGPKGWQNGHIKFLKKILHSTNFELLNQIKGNSINNYFSKLVISVMGGPFLLLSPCIKKPTCATDVNTGPA